MKDIKWKKRLEKLMEKYPSINRQKHLEDLHICENYLLGNTDVFMKLFEASRYKTLSYVCKNTWNKLFNLQDREDIVAETESTAIMKVHMFRGWSRYSTWMIGIARNRILSLVKKKTLMIETDAYAENTFYSKATDDPIALWESNQYVSGLLGHLSGEDRSIVVDIIFYQKSFEIIANEKNLSANIVITQYEKAIERLKSIILCKSRDL